MARIARYVVPDLPHHVTQRGNRRERVFFGDDDRVSTARSPRRLEWPRATLDEPNRRGELELRIFLALVATRS